MNPIRYNRINQTTEQEDSGSIINFTEISEQMIVDLDDTGASFTHPNVDVVKLFMPVNSTFNSDKENILHLKAIIANDVVKYVTEVLKEFE